MYVPIRPFCGEYWDSETDSIYLRNRYYNPNTGRFITEDPIRDGMNWYVYAGNNPVAFVDPWGLRITLSGDSSYWDETFAELQMLTDDKLSYDKNTGEIKIVSEKEGVKSTGTELVRSLIRKKESGIEFDLKIQRNGADENGNIMSTKVSRMNKNSALINLNDQESLSTEVLVANGDGTNRYEVPESFIILGHEMIHVYQGTDAPMSNGGRHLYRDVDGIWKTEQGINDGFYDKEYETVGLWYISGSKRPNNRSINPYFVQSNYHSITENSIRAENNMRLRAAYKSR